VHRREKLKISAKTLDSGRTTKLANDAQPKTPVNRSSRSNPTGKKREMIGYVLEARSSPAERRNWGKSRRATRRVLGLGRRGTESGEPRVYTTRVILNSKKRKKNKARAGTGGFPEGDVEVSRDEGEDQQIQWEDRLTSCNWCSTCRGSRKICPSRKKERKGGETLKERPARPEDKSLAKPLVVKSLLLIRDVGES